MVLPYISSVSREVLLAVPRSQREAALALGATRWETIWDAVLPYARSGIIGGVILGLGRALGETMAVTMLIGNRHEISASLFAPGYTMASLHRERVQRGDERRAPLGAHGRRRSCCFVITHHRERDRALARVARGAAARASRPHDRRASSPRRPPRPTRASAP